MEQRTYLCIDLKSFYASCECVERGLDPLRAHLVVADINRTEKTICLAVSVAMKKLGVKNRCRLYEIPKEIDYLIAQPRMQKYIDYSAKIYAIYLRHFSKDDIFVYSIDEVFIDVSSYLTIYHQTAKEMANYLLDLIAKEVGVKATCGIGTNLYLAKVALDITAKHATDYIGILDEEMFKKTLWNHQPLTDFWRIGKQTEKRLNRLGIETLGQLAWCDEEIIYQEFGIDGELLIDHAWGIEPTTIEDIKAYQPKSNSICSGQVLSRNYTFSEGLVIVKEMIDLLALQLVDKQLVSDQIGLSVRFDFHSEIPSVHGSISLPFATNNNHIMTDYVVKLYRKLVFTGYSIRAISISINHTRAEDQNLFYQGNLFDEIDDVKLQKEKEIQKTLNQIKKKFGKNAVLKGLNFEKGATTIERNQQIGGHKSGQKT